MVMRGRHHGPGTPRGADFIPCRWAGDPTDGATRPIRLAALRGPVAWFANQGHVGLRPQRAPPEIAPGSHCRVHAGVAFGRHVARSNPPFDATAPMYRLSIVLVLALLAACQTAAPPSPSPSAVHASGPDRAEVLGMVESFLQGLRSKDTTLMSAHTDSLTRFTLVRPRPGGGTRVVVLTAPQFIRLISRPDQPGPDEPIRNPVVHVSGDLASVWAEYQVRRDGAVTHCGYDAFHLHRRGGRWRLLNVSDTFQNTGCGAPWSDTPLR